MVRRAPLTVVVADRSPSGTASGLPRSQEWNPGGTVPDPHPQKGAVMPAWLILIILGVVLLIIGVAVSAAKLLIWVGIAVLVISLIMGLMRRTRA
jgi:Flp pilus assembly protein TadB